MDRLDRWVSPINILFFVLSGAELDLTILANPLVLLIGVVYIAARSAGKISGSWLSCRATRCSPDIQKYLGITLLPQAGAQRGAVLGAGVRAGGPHADQDVPDCCRRNSSRGPHQRPRGEQAGNAGRSGVNNDLELSPLRSDNHSGKIIFNLQKRKACGLFFFVFSREES